MPSDRFVYTYEDVISIENLLEAWREFIRGKRHRKDAQEFERYLMANIFSLHESLADGSYRHSPYEAFGISDPKPRRIHKASVEDRVLHRAVYRKLYPFFERAFIADSFSCREGKGTHKALDRFRGMAWKASRNHTRTCWVLKCDIRRFFASIHHGMLLDILAAKIGEPNIIKLLRVIVGSFRSGISGIGLPLGNLTSQLFANVYLNEFDQFMKHRLKARHYIRYADDFSILSEDRGFLEGVLPEMDHFLREMLRLEMHPDKVFIKTIASGVDFLGWVHFPNHRILRTVTKRRVFQRIKARPWLETKASYLGLLGHGNAHRLSRKLSLLSISRRGNMSQRTQVGFEPENRLKSLNHQPTEFVARSISHRR